MNIIQKAISAVFGKTEKEVEDTRVEEKPKVVVKSPEPEPPKTTTVWVRISGNRHAGLNAFSDAEKCPYEKAIQIKDTTLAICYSACIGRVLDHNLITFGRVYTLEEFKKALL